MMSCDKLFFLLLRPEPPALTPTAVQCKTTDHFLLVLPMQLHHKIEPRNMKELTGLIIEILPATHDVPVHEQRDIQCQSLQKKTGSESASCSKCWPQYISESSPAYAGLIGLCKSMIVPFNHMRACLGRHAR